MVRVKVNYLSEKDIARELKRLERRYGIASSEFYERYNLGKMGDSEEVVRWASLYEVSLERARRHVKA